ncbi:hypothetical protein NPA31_005190 [Aurantimonas sp. MSK8Z-1]|uniref:hypothetical protein n=1 Tax=Mangrovibrevibacter kandeliae TaxID=2968473 RepID=UPI002117A0AE|nr:hypothetical protein [Aurantimonas sp. MSK8Z-1]MCW4114356.1 hypothetical protein [Aurantimonas sp. MSK8Z-1]
MLRVASNTFDPPSLADGWCPPLTLGGASLTLAVTGRLYHDDGGSLKTVVHVLN